MNILAIGDVVSQNGCDFLRSKLRAVKKDYEIDLTIANGENSAVGNGITPSSATHLFDSGVDVITTGNHAFRRRQIYSYFDEKDMIIRPANYPNKTPGNGYCIIDMLKFKVAIINLSGVVFMDNLACPFQTADKILYKLKDQVNVILVDFHAEATGEKYSLAYYLDGRVSALFGTHTHVQTADEQILPKGTGYMSDLGMTGAINSVLGVDPKLTIKRMKDKLPVKFETVDGKSRMDCAIFNVDSLTGKCKSLKRLQII